MKKNPILEPAQELPWDDEEKTVPGPDEEWEEDACPPDDVQWNPWEPTLSIYDVSKLIDQMVMDIQHLELEIVRTRYKLSFHLEPPYDEYMRMEIFSGMGSRYGGDPVYDEYLSLRGFGEYDDAIDTPFHVRRMQRLARGYDDYPDLYP